jgi:SAM-dependent methyltransferase
MQQPNEFLDEVPAGVIDEISPRDAMYRGKWDEYLQGGVSALRCIRLALLMVNKQDVNRILDFGCGHGRVLRVLKAAFPEASLTAMDLDREAVDFCADALGAAGIYSHEVPERIQIEGSFDLIWCGSVLTHVDAEAWRAILDLLASRLRRRGILVFTTAGRHVVECMRQGEFLHLTPDQAHGLLGDYETTGFGYRDYPDRTGYGLARASPAWVCKELERIPTLRLVGYGESAWGYRQDVVACLRVRPSTGTGPSLTPTTI